MSKTSERGAVATSQGNSIRKKRLTQEDRVLQYLRDHNGLTTRGAVVELNIMNPQQRILNLRERGYNIETEYKVSPAGARYAVYRLKEDKNDN